MAIHVDKDCAYLLHTKPYRENSALVYCLTQQHGKVNFIVNGIKSKASAKSPNANKRALLQITKPLTISYELKHNLSKLQHIELAPTSTVVSINDFMLYQYIHELLLIMLPPQLPVTTIFSAYQLFLSRLSRARPHFALRQFEMTLIDFFDDLAALVNTVDRQQPVIAGMRYYLDNNQLYEKKPYPKALTVSAEQIFAFNHLLNFWDNESHDERIDPQTGEILARGAQPICSHFMTLLIGERPLKTRHVYRDLQSMNLL